MHEIKFKIVLKFRIKRLKLNFNKTKLEFFYNPFDKFKNIVKVEFLKIWFNCFTNFLFIC